MTKLDDFEQHLKRLRRDAQDNVWIPPFVRECGSEQEVQEWKTLNAKETAQMRRLVREPVTDAGECARQIFAIREPMLAFEKRMRQKHPSMPKTLNEQTAEDIARAENDAEYREREGLNQKGPYD
jgi:hypothetical protein